MATWAGRTIIYVDSNGDNSDGTTWATAWDDIQTGLTAATGGTHVIFMAHNHAEAAFTVNTTLTGGTEAAPVDIYRVNSGTDVYAPVDQGTPGTANISSTAAYDILLGTSARWHGVYIECGDDFFGTMADRSNILFDCYIEINSSGGTYRPSQTDGKHDVINSTVNFSGASCSFNSGSGEFNMYGGVITGNIGTALCLSPGSAVRYNFYGVDLSAIGDQTLVQSTSNRDMRVTFFQCNMPATYTRLTAPTANTCIVDIIGSDDAGASYVRERGIYKGAITADTSMTRTGGFTDKDGDTALSHKYESASHVDKEGPLEGIPLTAWVDSTGSKTFTLEMRHDFTSAPNDDEVYCYLYYMGTSGETEFLVDHGERPKPSVAPSTLSASSETWSTNTNKIYAAITVTVNNIGLYMLVPYLGKYEASKYLWVCPQVDIT